MATDDKSQLAARAGYEAAGGTRSGVMTGRIEQANADAAPEAASELAPTTPPRDPNAPPDPIDADFHAKALYAVLAQSMRSKGHAPPEWNALPEATRGTWATAIASIPTKG